MVPPRLTSTQIWRTAAPSALTGQLVVRTSYELDTRGIMQCSSAEHILAPDSDAPPDVTAFLMAMQRAVPFEFFDPSDTELRTTVSLRTPSSLSSQPNSTSTPTCGWFELAAEGYPAKCSPCTRGCRVSPDLQSSGSFAFQVSYRALTLRLALCRLQGIPLH